MKDTIRKPVCIFGTVGKTCKNKDGSVSFWVGKRGSGRQKFVLGPLSKFIHRLSGRVLVEYIPGYNPKIIEVHQGPDIGLVRRIMER